MKLFNLLLIFLIWLMLPLAAGADNSQDEFQKLLQQMQQAPTDKALREKVIKSAQQVKPSPAVSDEALRHEGRGKFAFKNAKSADDYLDAAKEYEQAVAIAPWVTGYYSDLCKIYEKAGKYADAKHNCEVILPVTTDPQIVADLKERISGLEYGIEKTKAAKKAGNDTAATAPDKILYLTCKDDPVIRHYVIDTSAKTVEMESITPNGTPNPHIYNEKLPNPVRNISLTMNVSDQEIRWIVTVPIDAVPTNYVLDRHTGSLHQTRDPGDIWPNGQDMLWQCEKQEKRF